MLMYIVYIRIYQQCKGSNHNRVPVCVIVPGETPLHECVRLGMFECVSELLRHGSDVNHLNSMGLTPLHLALQNTDRFRKDSVCLKFVRELVTKGYNADVNIGDKTGKFQNFLSPAHDIGISIYLAVRPCFVTG